MNIVKQEPHGAQPTSNKSHTPPITPPAIKKRKLECQKQTDTIGIYDHEARNIVKYRKQIKQLKHDKKIMAAENSNLKYDNDCLNNCLLEMNNVSLELQHQNTILDQKVNALQIKFTAIQNSKIINDQRLKELEKTCLNSKQTILNQAKQLGAIRSSNNIMKSQFESTLLKLKAQLKKEKTNAERLKQLSSHIKGLTSEKRELQWKIDDLENDLQSSKLKLTQKNQTIENMRKSCNRRIEQLYHSP